MVESIFLGQGRLTLDEQMFLQEHCAVLICALCSCRNVGNLFCTSIHSCAQHFSIELRSEADYSASALLLHTIQWDV